MPVGCDFVCENKNCMAFNRCISLKGKWPIGDINDIIESKLMKEEKNKEIKQKMIELKKYGDLYSYINYPNDAKIQEVGYRIQKICSSCSFIAYRDFVGENCSDENFDKCPKCKEGDLMSFDDVTKNDLLCPFCKQKLTQHRWCTKDNISENSNKEIKK